ncbi:phosphoribosylaminoimidazolesuccinocarboxamide synthase [Candidatus Pantoea edessiphila]|uniref:Phosphoribosylaminoimidazole-succinocarboxamide synthase n=1 Tax=Candidatus Pantoea edessiphila TaxID=2044610 RepID=A0A2P5SYE5_9GAMM|nr:phosphoribosylaminoimidazolesuccinocarboxamide synthase [Candidatus Pantoea edessiphila]MBK4775504.1 phosphoribosylaminoimidazolesuccinocarboxamide synthase [Pantoea sp. Edef]PPI87367.1 phosphoribosylaminoimidazolesuccinocarboxamide synthase [Candidatus Pantoea edessiphila]
MKKTSELYRGKSKTVYCTEEKDFLIIHFRDDISANNGLKFQNFAGKGSINNAINHFVMTKLQDNGIKCHLENKISDNELLVKKLIMLPIECVLRNRAAGSLIKRIDIKEGIVLNPPIFEIFLKNDMKNDPMINHSYCETFGWVSKKHLITMKSITYKINDILNKLFNDISIILVDFKLEFGLLNNEIVLGDEFSPDTARLWDIKNMDKLDKDLFRKNPTNSSGVIQAYELVASRLSNYFIK